MNPCGAGFAGGYGHVAGIRSGRDVVCIASGVGRREGAESVCPVVPLIGAGRARPDIIGRRRTFARRTAPKTEKRTLPMWSFSRSPPLCAKLITTSEQIRQERLVPRDDFRKFGSPSRQCPGKQVPKRKAECKSQRKNAAEHPPLQNAVEFLPIHQHRSLPRQFKTQGVPGVNSPHDGESLPLRGRTSLSIRLPRSVCTSPPLPDR